jgi:uncharacterized membrane protein YfcA
MLITAFLAGLGGGAMNALAGGGTVVAFSLLVWLGLPPVVANASTAVALWPASVAGAWEFRHHIIRARRWWFWLLVPSALGGTIGARLLVRTPPASFASLAPWLVLASSALIAIERGVAGRLEHGHERRRSRGWRVLAVMVQLVAAVYGGYFGGGLGILVLTGIGLFGVRDVRRADGLKNLFILAIKGVAAACFVGAAVIAWRAAAVAAVGAVVGGYAAARFGRTLAPSNIRWAATGIGVAIATLMFVKLAG